MAILSIIAPFVGFSLAGLVLGIIGLNQIKKTGEQGHGLALAGTIVSGVFILLSVIVVVFWIVVVASVAGSNWHYSDF
ncbi:DUF4190 domain-containing protein [Plantibacter sp. YIM 135249]|uniref:DUF4190 domain-containing protein n=1 Tax=Plantibacter sp. YIM 135249 TaxID=3423918 RepID=UPI003D358D4A